jgi:hypothetical protein
MADDGHSGYAFGRWQAGQRAIVVLNDDRVTHTYRIPVAPVEGLPHSQWIDALRGGTILAAANDTVAVKLAPYSGTVLLQTDLER